jgi:hypothetical protein
VPEWVPLDLSPARKFGEIVELLPAGPMIRATAHVTATLRSKLSDFTDKDYLLCMGDPTVIGLACVMAARVNGGRYSCLVWDREARDYFCVNIDTVSPFRAAAMEGV